MSKDWSEIEYPSNGDGRARALWWTHFLGAPVFPCGVIAGKKGSWTKQPFMVGWQKVENCATTVKDAEDLWGSKPGWWRADCGVLLNDFTLVDLDTKEGWYDGKSEFKKLVAEIGMSLEETLKGAIFYETPGRSGGVHILWKRPDNAKSHKKSVPAAGIEVLGNAHYMLAPCSLRPDNPGCEYKLLGYPKDLQLTEPPAKLWAFLKKNGGENNSGSGGGGKPSLETALSWSYDGVVLAGLRHDVLYKEAARRAAAGGSEEDVAEWLREILQAEPVVIVGVEDFGEDEIERMARNAVRWASSLEEDGYGEVFNVDSIRKSAEFIRYMKRPLEDSWAKYASN